MSHGRCARSQISAHALTRARSRPRAHRLSPAPAAALDRRSCRSWRWSARRRWSPRRCVHLDSARVSSPLAAPAPPPLRPACLTLRPLRCVGSSFSPGQTPSCQRPRRRRPRAHRLRTSRALAAAARAPSPHANALAPSPSKTPSCQVSCHRLRCSGSALGRFSGRCSGSTRAVLGQYSGRCARGARAVLARWQISAHLLLVWCCERCSSVIRTWGRGPRRSPCKILWTKHLFYILMPTC